MSQQFVDTNILLYAYDDSAGERHERAYELVARLGAERRGVLSIQVLQEFYVNVTRKGAHPLSPEQARARLRILSRWPTHSPLGHDVITAAELAQAHTLSFWDAMIVQSARRMDCDTLWSEDLNDGQVIAGVRIQNPLTA